MRLELHDRLAGMVDMTESGVMIQPASDEMRPHALALLVREHGPMDQNAYFEQVQAAISLNPPARQGLLTASREGRLVGVIWIQLHPGKTANVWPPRLESGEPDSTHQDLLRSAIDFARARHAWLVQSLLPVDSGADARQLVAAGFFHLSDLLYLVSHAKDAPGAPLAAEVEFEPVVVGSSAEASTERFAEIVQGTYEQTLDCPRLNDARSIHDVLEGYRAVGATEGARWLLVRHGGHDVGCLLLAEHAFADQWELVYMGLTPRWRGRGWGLEIVRHAQWLMRQAGMERLVLAVDADNRPAIAAYAAAGFVAWDKRSVFARFISEPIPDR